MTRLTTERPHTTGERPRGGLPTPVVAGVAALAAAGVFVAATVELTHGGEGAAGVVAAALRFARYAGTLAAVGGAAFLAVARPPGVPVQEGGRRLALAAAVTGIAAALLSLPAHAVYLAADPAVLGEAEVWRSVLASGFGRSALIGAAGLALLVLALLLPQGPAAAAAGAAGGLLALGAFLLTGHTATSQPRWLVLSANLAHTAAGSVWLGGLLLLPGALRDRHRAGDGVGGARLVARFSAVASAALLVAAAGGGALAWVEVRAFAALGTPYGAVLVAKVVLVAAVVVLGLYNNRRLVPVVERAAVDGWRALRRVVRLEAAGLVAVLAVTAVLVNVVPARVDAGIDAQVLRVAPLGPQHTLTVVVEPAQPGANEIHLYIEHDRRVLDQVVEDVTLGFVPPGQEAAAATVRPAQAGPGHWLHLGAELAEAGEWRLEVTGSVDGEAHTATVRVPLESYGEPW